jgi:hypothetical protein
MSSKYMISAKFGNKEIVSGDLNTFFGGAAQNAEWTENLIYRNAKLCDVNTTFSRLLMKKHLLTISTKKPFSSHK